MSTQLTKQNLYDILYPISAAKHFGVNESSYLCQNVRDTAALLFGIMNPNEVMDTSTAPIVRIPTREMLLDRLEARLNENLIEPYVKIRIQYTLLDKKGPLVHLTLTTFDNRGAYDMFFLKKFNVPANFQLRAGDAVYPDTESFNKTLEEVFLRLTTETNGLFRVI